MILGRSDERSVKPEGLLAPTAPIARLQGPAFEVRRFVEREFSSFCVQRAFPEAFGRITASLATASAAQSDSCDHLWYNLTSKNVLYNYNALLTLSFFFFFFLLLLLTARR